MDRHSVSKAAPGSVALMEADPEGDYVLYEDAEKEIAELRRYDARRLLACPECGAQNVASASMARGWAVWCDNCSEVHRSHSGTIIDALLAWHEKVAP